jgi:hypothetical protein
MRRGIVLLVLVACATTGADGEGDRNLPTVGMGPFRKLDPEEVRGIAPFVLDDREALYREPAVLGEEGTSTIFLYAVARQADGKDAIVRSRAPDGRSFFGTSFHGGRRPKVVLTADAAWEGSAVGGPSVIRANGEVLLYYSAAGGIGLSRSSDGLTFRKEPAPVLVRDPNASWETTEVHAPSVYALPDGRLRMLYAAGVSIGEAESTDGVRWARLGSSPVLGPVTNFDPASLLPNEKPPFDTASVGDPCVVTRTTPAGRFHVRVLYTGTVASGATTIGFAARYGETGPLTRQPVPSYSVNLSEAAPAFAETSQGSFLYVQQLRREGPSTAPYLAIAAAFAPGNVKLPEPAEFPEEP